MQRAKSENTGARRCIYCLLDKPNADFNREHVVQQAFEVFDSNNLVLTCVCRACNKTFGDTIDLHLSRDSLEGFDRYVTGGKSALEYKSLGLRSKTRVEFPKDGPFAGAEGYFVPGADGAPLGVTVKPRVGFRHQPDGPFVLWAPLDRLPSIEALKESGFRKGEPVYMQTQGETSPEELRAALVAKGLTFTITEEVPQFMGQAEVEAVFDLSRPQFRAVTKIALNYLAAVAGPEIALSPLFDQARCFVLLDEGVRPIEVPLRRQADAQRCHYVSVQAVGGKVVAHVSLFMRVMYYTVTLAPAGFDLPLQSAHFFDLDTRRVIPTLPLPIEIAA